MARIEQFGSETFILSNIPADGMINRYELVELIEQAIRLADITIEEIAQNQVDKLKEIFEN